jgi:NADH-quinone oxidoreductase subunit M
MGLPGTSSFIGEFLIFLGIFNINIFVSFLSCFSIVLSAVYSLWLCNRFVFGRISNKIYFYSDLNFREFFIISFMLFFVFLLGIFPNIFLTLIHNDVSNIVLSFENWPIIKTDVMKHVNTENIIFFLNNE